MLEKLLERMKNVITDDEYEFIENCLESLKEDASNIYYLNKFAFEGEDNDVSENIIDYIVETLELDDKSDISVNALPELVDFHYGSLETMLNTYYMAYSLVTDDIDDINNMDDLDDEDFSDTLETFIYNLKNYTKLTTTLSDFIMNYCAITYLRRVYLYDSSELEEKYKIKLPSTSFFSYTYNLALGFEFMAVDASIGTLTQTKVKEFKVIESKYNDRYLATTALDYAIMHFTFKMVDLVKVNSLECYEDELDANSIAFYCAMFDYLVRNTYSDRNFNKDIQVCIMKEAMKGNRLINSSNYRKIINLYEEYLDLMIENDDIINMNVISKFASSFTFFNEKHLYNPFSMALIPLVDDIKDVLKNKLDEEY